MILITEFYQTLFFLSFNHIFLYFIGAFDVFLFSFSWWNDNLSYTTISITKLDDINELGIKLGIDLLGHAYPSELIRCFDLGSDFRPLSQTTLEDQAWIARAFLLYVVGAISSSMGVKQCP